MKNLFIDSNCLKGSRVVINGELYHYLKNVRRLHEGSKLETVIGMKKYSLVVSAITNGRIICEILTRRYIQSGRWSPIFIYQGLLKSKKMDLAVSKLSELGVAEFFPIKTERAIPQIKIKAERIKRWKRLAREGAKVSGFERVMEVHEPIRFEEAKHIVDGEKNIFLFSTFVKGVHIKNLLETIPFSEKNVFHLFFGPEGGFSEQEAKSLINLNAVPVTMGDFVLKSETASIVASGFLRLYYSEVHGREP